MARRFHTLDVFTDVALAGNPLAVVADAEDLDDARMQSIAAEFNLSETVFVLEAKNPVNTARVRIFTPARELPFAGHPTVGTAALLAHLRAPDLLAAQDLRIVLEEGVGDIVCVVRHRKGQALAAYFDLPKLPERLADAPPSKAEIAMRTGLSQDDIGFDGHEPRLFSAGVPYLFVPVRSLEAIGRADPRLTRWGADGVPAVYLYTREAAHVGSAFHARMFAGGLGVSEDPATGSAAAAFAGVAFEFDRHADGEHLMTIEQGIEMGRASYIGLGFKVEGRALRAATIGGSAVIVSGGSLDI